MNIYEIIFLCFSFLAFCLAFLLFIKKRGDKIANRLLGIYLLLFSFNLLYNVLYWTKELFAIDFVHLVATNVFPWVLYGPILYLYVRRITFNSNFRWLDLIHLIPTLFYLLNYSPFFFKSSTNKIEILTNGLLGDFFIWPVPRNYIVLIAIMLTYSFLIYFNFIKGYRDANKKKWLSWLSFSYFGYVISFISYFVLREFGFIEVHFDYFISFFMIFFIGLVAYFGFLQPQVFEGIPIQAISGFSKYKKTGLSKENSTALKDSLIDLMQTEKPHLNSEINLSSLSEQLNLSRHHLSQIINENFNTNFFDFINQYRIREARSIIKENPEISISEIIYTVGFSNRVSFNKAFKKHTGLTPSQFKMSLEK
jgi:AraC-like DNA-binding protein